MNWSWFITSYSFFMKKSKKDIELLIAKKDYEIKILNIEMKYLDSKENLIWFKFSQND